MDRFDAKAHWQGVYRSKAPSEVSWYQAVPAVSLALIEHCGLRAADPVIDVGGGASVLVDHLLGRGYSRLSVLDVSGIALDAARRRLGESARQVEWIESDITAFEPPRKFALWHDRAVFHFLTERGDRERYVDALKQALTPAGQAIIAAFAIGGPEKCSGLPIVQYDSDKLLAELGDGFAVVEQRNEAHVTPAQRTQAFAYFRLIRRPEAKRAQGND